MRTKQIVTGLVAGILWAGTMVGGNLAAADWPQWRGPNRDAKSLETGLLREWPEEGPRVVWHVENAGVGYSSLAVENGRVITQGDLDGVEHIIAYDANDGTLLWAVQPEPVARALDERVATQFKNFDKNEDGQLDELEALSGLGWNFNRFEKPVPGIDSDQIAEIARERAAWMFEQLDANGDGLLDYSELHPAMRNELERIDRPDEDADKEALAAERAKELLAAHDEDGDGRISREESRDTILQRLFNRIDQKEPGSDKGDDLLTEAEMRSFFLQHEPGRDGKISPAELEQVYATQFPGQRGILGPDDLRSFYGGYRNSYGDGPRGTPTIDGNRVYAEGGNGDVTCLDVESGKTLWHINLTEDLGGQRPGWGYSESPLVMGELLIVTPGSPQGTMAALNKSDGSIVWQSEAVTQPAHYASPQVAEIAGVRQIVQFARESVFGITTDGKQLLWSYNGANNGTANVATPIVAGDYVLASSSYGMGSGLVKVSPKSNNEQEAEEIYFQKRLANHHGGLVRVGDHLYGFGQGLMCLDFLTGEIVWQNRSVGKGSLIYADGMLYCLGEGHQVALVEATPEEYRERGRFSIESLGRPAWAHPVVANGTLYIRNMQQLTAYDIKGTD